MQTTPLAHFVRHLKQPILSEQMYIEFDSSLNSLSYLTSQVAHFNIESICTVNNYFGLNPLNSLILGLRSRDDSGII
jgi:hypothetical protein